MLNFIAANLKRRSMPSPEKMYGKHRLSKLGKVWENPTWCKLLRKKEPLSGSPRERLL